MRKLVPSASRSCDSVMNPSSRILDSTTRLRATRALEVRPGRERGRRAREAGDQRALGEVQLLGRPSEEMPRHGLDAVDAGAQIDPIEVQLEYLLLGELPVDHQREHRFANLAAVRLLVRQEERPGQLLRHRAAALDRAPWAQVPEDGAAERDGIDARMRVEPVILDGDEGVLQVLGNLGERDVAAMLVHPEPAPPISREEPRVAHTARQPVHRVALPEQPRNRERGEDDQRGEHDSGDPIAKRSATAWSRRLGPERPPEMQDTRQRRVVDREREGHGEECGRHARNHQDHRDHDDCPAGAQRERQAAKRRASVTDRCSRRARTRVRSAREGSPRSPPVPDPPMCR